MKSIPAATGLPVPTAAELTAVKEMIASLNARGGGRAVSLTAHVRTTGRPVVTVHGSNDQNEQATREYRR